MNEIERDEVLEKFVQQLVNLERRVGELESENMQLIQLGQSMSEVVKTLAGIVKALDQQMLEVVLLMGLMPPGDDGRIH
jgi:hypothetical protein